MKRLIPVLLALLAAPAWAQVQSTGGVMSDGNSGGATSSAAVIAFWSGTCDVTTFLRGDGACATPSGASGANPSGTIGLTAVNGAAATFLRSDGAPALSQAIVPTWTGIHTWSLAEPRQLLSESDQAADEKLWDWDIQAKTFTLRTRTDADGAGVNLFSFVRGTGTAMASMSFGNATNNPSFFFSGSGTTIFGGTVQSNTNLVINASNPALFFTETDQGTNLKGWATDVNGGIYKIRTITDGFGAGKDVFAVARGATTTVASLAFGNATDNPTYTFLGAGASTFGGAIISAGTKFTATGCSNGTTVGGAIAGSFVSGTTGTCTVTITLPTATNGWTCYAADVTTPIVMTQTAKSTTSCTVSGTTVTNDVVTFMAMGY